MKYENITSYTDNQFRRITGVKRTTFEKMLSILLPKHEEKLKKGGRKHKLILEEMLLATLKSDVEYEVVRLMQPRRLLSVQKGAAKVVFRQEKATHTKNAVRC